MGDVAPAEHALTSNKAINTMLSNLATVFSVPKWLLGKLGGLRCSIPLTPC